MLDERHKDRGTAVSPALRVALHVGFVLSGMASLMFEVIWFGALGFGTDSVALSVAVITAAYMAGLAIGNHLGGQIAERIHQRLLLYAGVEAAVAACGLWVPMAMQRLAAVVASGAAAAWLGWAAVGVILLIPTTAMGMTLPLLTTAVDRRRTSVGATVGMLYGANTGGAMLGSLAAGVILLPMLGLVGSSFVAVGIQTTVALVAAVAAWRSGWQPGLTPAPVNARPSLRRQGVAVLVFASLASGTAMLVQVAWATLAARWLGTPTIAFAGTVFVYLLGLSLGGLVVSRIVDRVGRLDTLLSRILLGTSVCLTIGLFAVWHLVPVCHETWLPWLFGISLLPATIGMGMAFPTFVRATAKLGHPVGLSVGSTSAASTVGAIAGSLSGAVLLPAVGAVTSLFGALAVYTLLATLVSGAWRATGSWTS